MDRVTYVEFVPEVDPGTLADEIAALRDSAALAPSSSQQEGLVGELMVASEATEGLSALFDSIDVPASAVASLVVAIQDEVYVEAKRAAVRCAEATEVDPESECIHLGNVWVNLASGRWAVVDQWASESAAYISVTRRSANGDGGVLGARDLEILGLALMAVGQKTIAIELGLANSTVMRSLSRSLSTMGFGCRHTQVSSLLVASFRAYLGTTELVRARLLRDGSQNIVVSIPRPELCLEPLLTPAEFAFARHLADGANPGQIAKERGISRRAIANRSLALFRKLGVSSRLELLNQAVLRFREPDNLCEGVQLEDGGALAKLSVARWRS